MRISLSKQWHIILIAVGSLTTSAVQAADTDAARGAFFEQHIRPVLIAKCVKCHGEKKQEAELRLDSLPAMLKGGESGPVLVKSQPVASLILEALRYESFEMPPTGRLPESTVRKFEVWISNGAVWPEHSETLREDSGLITDADRQWWAFQPLIKPDVPETADDNWSRNPIDQFVLRKLAERKMQPTSRVDKATLVRRLYFDLIGLPPSPEEIDAFVEDESEHEVDRLVDRLLEDERYGEHWARYWLDLVRFSESDGWKQDAFRPHIWRYRDYVVRSFNNDKPYPQFVCEQLAGDEIDSTSPDHLAATGFLRLGIYEFNQRDARSHWNDVMNEITDVTSDVFLGMGMACARCHDHKFDPLPQRDYFKLRAFFEPIEWRDDIRYASQNQIANYEAQRDKWKEAAGEVLAKIDALLKPYHDRKWKKTVGRFPLDIQACFLKPVEQRSSWEHQMAYLVARQFEEGDGGPLKDISKKDKAKYEVLQKELAAFEQLKPGPLPPLMTATDFAGPVAPTVIPDANETAVEPGFLTVLTSWSSAKPELSDLDGSSGRRTALARWIGRADNPLTTRVIVNRIWQQHFGQGIVATTSDFGHLGQPPTHPELLDWLTVTFVENGWSIKKLHKLILTSATWQQSSRNSRAAEYQQLDPAEDLLWRFRIRRLTAEQIRDAMLSASGELQSRIGGPSVDGNSHRRSLYVKNIRNTPDKFLHSFDASNGLKSVAERNTTTTPVQSLMMINGDISMTRAAKMAECLSGLKFESHDQLLRHAIRLAWGRTPTDVELEFAIDFVGEERTDKLTDFCHVLLNSNEFLYVD